MRTSTSRTLEHARTLVLRHGWNAMAHQILNPGIRRWLSVRQKIDHGLLSA